MNLKTRVSPKPRNNRRAYLRALANMTPSQRVLKVFELSAMTKELLKDGLRQRFPERNETDLHAIFLERLRRCHNNNY